MKGTVLLIILLIFISLQAIPVVRMSGDISLTHPNFTIKVNTSNGVLTIKDSHVIIRDLGLGVWTREWKKFYFQEDFSARVAIKNSTILICGRIGSLVNYTTRIRAVGKALLVTVNISLLSAGIEEIAWGSWDFPVREYAGSKVYLLTWNGLTEATLPRSYVNSPLVYSESSYGLGIGGYVFVSLKPVVMYVDDERAWGGNGFSFKIQVYRRVESGTSLSLAVFENVGKDSLLELLQAVKSLWTLRGIKDLATEKKALMLRFYAGNWSELPYAVMDTLSNYLSSLQPPRHGLLRVAGKNIVGAKGEVVVLRGVNYIGMEFGWFGQNEKDFELIVEWGLNVVRLPVAWRYIEPRQGWIDSAYLALIVRNVALAKKHGLYVVLDFHQWHWGPRYHGCGMPAWVVPNALNYREASVIFFRDKKYWELFARAWLLIASMFAGEEAVAAYDIFNEPMPYQEKISNDKLYKYISDFYSYISSRIRNVDEGRIVMYMPLWGSDMDNAFRINDSNAVLTGHFYIGGTWDGETGYEHISRRDIEVEVEKWVKKAEELNVPLWVAEFGVGSQAFKAEEWVMDVLNFFDKWALGWAYWCFWRSDKGFGLLYKNGTVKPIARFLSRPYVETYTSKPLIVRVNYTPFCISFIAKPVYQKLRFTVHFPASVKYVSIELNNSLIGFMTGNIIVLNINEPRTAVILIKLCESSNIPTFEFYKIQNFLRTPV